jgi:glutamate 5-kinase
VRRGTAQKKAITAKEVDADVVIDIGQEDGLHMNQPRQADEAAALPGAQQIAPIVR